MERISTFMYCEGAGLGPNISPQMPQTLHIISPIQVITPEFIPTLYSFVAIFGVLGVDMSQSHTIKTIFRSEQDELFSSENVLPINHIQDVLPLEMRGFIMNTVFQNIRLRHNGVYETEILVDNKSLGKFPIQVQEVNHEKQ